MKTIILGPCVMESFSLLEEAGAFTYELSAKYQEFDFVFKSSFDKANRTSHNSFRGPGLEKGMLWMSDLKSKYDLRVTSDIHEAYQASLAGEILDIIQIPAFLCRQTDILKSSCKTGKHINVKKGQFLSGKDMENVAHKLNSFGAKSFGIIEMTPPSIGVMQKMTKHIKDKQEKGEIADQSILQIIPYIVNDWRQYTDKTIFNFEMEVNGWSNNKYSLVYKLAEKLKVGIQPEMLVPHEDDEVLVPIGFRDGIKSLFIVQDLSGELL